MSISSLLPRSKMLLMLNSRWRSTGICFMAQVFYLTVSFHKLSASHDYGPGECRIKAIISMFQRPINTTRGPNSDVLVYKFWILKCTQPSSFPGKNNSHTTAHVRIYILKEKRSTVLRTMKRCHSTDHLDSQTGDNPRSTTWSSNSCTL
jgi:hypothetical protein